MGKLINTSDLQQAFCCLDWASEHDLWTAQKAVDDAPEAIVRCGQCKHWQQAMTSTVQTKKGVKMASILILNNDKEDCDSCPLCALLPGDCIDDIGDCPLKELNTDTVADLLRSIAESKHE